MDVFDRRSDRRRSTVEVGSVFNKQARVDDTSLLEEEDDHDPGNATRRKRTDGLPSSLQVCFSSNISAACDLFHAACLGRSSRGGRRVPLRRRNEGGTHARTSQGICWRLEEMLTTQPFVSRRGSDDER
jgi:hypothetical protein